MKTTNKNINYFLSFFSDNQIHKEVMNKELKKADKQSLKVAYQALENCPEYQKEAEEREAANLEDVKS